MSGAKPEGPRPLQAVTLRNLLSFGPDSPTTPLGPLNVLIGPNGAGKSNLIEALALLRATPSDVRSVIVRGGGTSEWIWKGNPKATATIDALIGDRSSRPALWHTFAFHVQNQSFAIKDKRIENGVSDAAIPHFYYEYRAGHPLIAFRTDGADRPNVTREPAAADQSILAQLRDPDYYPEPAYVSDVYTAIRIYREWSFGHETVVRRPQPADMRNDRLEEDFSNLGLFLNRLRHTPRTKQALLTGLRDLYAGLDDFDVSVEGGTVQVFFTEGDFTIPATRLSDGTLRYLCLLAILLDPEPPRLVCIEEPELGLHPDPLPKIADLLVDASHRMQLILTTHSDILVDAMTERPESVLVCEKHDGRTQVNRLDSERLAQWLKKYRLGELWTRGGIGGTRW